MPRNDAGQGFDLNNNAAICEIDSPRDFVTGGPYVVVYTCDNQDRWAVVTLEWEGDRVLGVGCGKGRKTTLRANQRLLGHLYSGFR